MAATRPGSFRLFRFRGVDVFVHYTWFLVAYFIISTRGHAYSSLAWNVAEYLGLFAIVLLHEFGHVFACRQTGGEANEIVLWPLGGIAFGQPPPRATAELWTIAAGPLVNVVLFPVLWFAGAELERAVVLNSLSRDYAELAGQLFELNKGLLLFNLLPIFPLDGGQILRSLLWLRIGRARSLQVATTLGLVGIVVLVAMRLSASRDHLVWTLVLGGFLALQCFAGLQHARVLRALEQLPARAGFRCPSCQLAPPEAPMWKCAGCGHAFDWFWTRGVCPHCAAPRSSVPCPHCGAVHSLEAWETPPAAPTLRQD